VSVSHNTGCSSKSPEITINNVGIRENDASFLVNVFPNPVKDELMLELNFSKTENVIVNIINVAGQKIYSTTLKQVTGPYKRSLNLDGNPNGIYYLQIITNHTTMSKKIIKQD
jgi:hypothetical protein